MYLGEITQYKMTTAKKEVIAPEFCRTVWNNSACTQQQLLPTRSFILYGIQLAFSEIHTRSDGTSKAPFHLIYYFVSLPFKGI